ncbi:MAG: response regulator [Phycisphaeraceae bacterium]
MSDRKALLVEDDDRVISSFDLALTSLGHHWDRVTNQADAQERLSQEHFDYVLLDIDIPARPNCSTVMSEYAINLLSWIHRNCADTSRVIAITEEAEPVTLTLTLVHKSVDAFLTLPLADGALAGAVDAVVERNGVVDRSPFIADGHRAGQWLTVTQSARMLMDVVSGLSIEKARSRVSVAASRGEFTTNGENRSDRRIEPDSFNTWRLEQRERDLASSEQAP